MSEHKIMVDICVIDQCNNVTSHVNSVIEFDNPRDAEQAVTRINNAEVTHRNSHEIHRHAVFLS